MRKYNRELQKAISKQDREHEKSLMDDKKYVHINIGVNRWTNQFTCSAIEVSRESAVYAYEKLNSYHFIIGLNVYIVTQNLGVTRVQAENLCHYHHAGKFKKADTGEWS